MREIKFRYRWQHCRTKEILTAVLKIEEIERPNYTPEVFDIMWDTLSRDEYTGLCDKNGKEIYEGDVVEYENGNAGYGRPRHEEINRDVIPNICDYEKMHDGASWWKSGEIIGNIYDNPELLEVKS